MADKYVKIPMDGKVESLNASVAAAILMYEAKRQMES
jgi:TrmH family RNA methyltransferase